MSPTAMIKAITIREQSLTTVTELTCRLKRASRKRQQVLFLWQRQLRSGWTTDWSPNFRYASCTNQFIFAAGDKPTGTNTTRENRPHLVAECQREDFAPSPRQQVFRVRGQLHLSEKLVSRDITIRRLSLAENMPYSIETKLSSRKVCGVQVG